MGPIENPEPKKCPRKKGHTCVVQIGCEICGRYKECDKCQRTSEADVRLNNLLNAKEHLEHENAALTNLLENICKDLMDVDDAGRFTNSFYADTVNKMLGI